MPESHKTEHHGKKRIIYLGPKAQELVQPWLKNNLTAYLFSPIEAEQERQAKRRANRKSPMTPSQTKRKLKHNRTHSPRDHYDKGSYRQAIHRACDKALSPPEDILAEQLNPEQRQELKKWQKDHRWSPNQLRHSAATFLRKEFGIEAARMILGHSSSAVTEVYAEQDDTKAIEIMTQVG